MISIVLTQIFPEPYKPVYYNRPSEVKEKKTEETLNTLENKEEVKSKKKKRRLKYVLADFFGTLLPWAILGFFITLVLGFIALEIYVWVTYANTPVSELPSWVIFFMFGGRSRGSN